MENTVKNNILNLLNQASEDDTDNCYIRTSVLRAYVQQRLTASMFNEDKFIKALADLKNAGLIDAGTETYRITYLGTNELEKAINPPKDYTAIAINQNERNIILSKANMAVAIVSIVIAIFGLIGGLSWVRRDKIVVSRAYTKFMPFPVSDAVGIDNQAFHMTTLDNWFAQSPPKATFDGIPYALSANSEVIETKSMNSTNTSQIYLSIDKVGIVRLHLLINLSYGSSTFTEGIPINGSEIAKVILYSKDNQKWEYPLIAGNDIREWVIGSPNSVNHIDKDVHVWENTHKESGLVAVIDHVIVPVPESWRNKEIQLICIQDQSEDVLKNINPGLLLFGVTIEYIE